MKRLTYRSVCAASFACMHAAVLGQSSWVVKTPTVNELLSATTHGNGVHVAVGEGGAVLSSMDGSAWSAETSGTTAALRDVTFAEGGFVACGSQGTILTSPDGSNWTARTSGTGAFLSGIAHGEGRFVAVGGSGTILTSADAAAWSPASSGTGEFLQNVSFAEGLFIATGANGTILSSADGLSWSLAPILTGQTLTDSGYFGGKYLVIGQGGTLLTSTDGASWSFGNSGTLELLRAITDDGTSCIICGDNGIILRSGDGISWSPVSSGVATALLDVEFAGGKFVSVGEVDDADAVILVADRDPGFSWAAGEVSVGEADGSVMLMINRIGSTAAAATVDFQTVDSTATGGDDFEATATTASFAVGQSSVVVTIPINNNPAGEPEESFSVVLSSPIPTGLVLYSPSVAKVSIIDAQDSDFDGLPDDWETLHFGDIESNGPDDDPDLDGNTNDLELADGTDPDDGTSANYRLNHGVASGMGTVVATPDLPSYPAGTSVTLSPAGNGDFAFASWQGDATGNSNPLVIAINRDLEIKAVFTVSLADALDQDCLAFTLSGTGPPWFGQGLVTSDGSDAIETGGLTVGQASSVEATVHGPAEVSFHWKVSTSQFDSFRFFIDGSPRVSSSGDSAWKQQVFLIGAGTHMIRWTYAKNSTSSAGSNRAWIDDVRMDYGYQHWQRAHFNATDQANPLVSGTTADPDMDGSANLLEFLLDMHPKITDANPAKLPGISIMESDGTKVAALTWTQHRKRAETLDLSVEFSEDMEPGSWQTLVAPAVEISATSYVQTLQVTSVLPLEGQDRGFYRLAATMAP